MEDRIDTARIYSREVEHSEENLGNASGSISISGIKKKGGIQTCLNVFIRMNIWIP